MQSYPAYTRKMIDEEPLLNYRALRLQALRRDINRRREFMHDMSFAARVGVNAEGEHYEQLMTELTKRA